MRVITSNHHTRKIIATVMSFVMIVSLLAGVGVIFSRKSKVGASTNPILDYTNGTFDVADTDFMVLEIVPDASMAQFGYLVGGQEPVDLEHLSAEDRTKFYTAYENESLDLFEFDNRVNDVTDADKYTWMSYIDAEQYGEFVYSGSGAGRYDVSDATSRYEKVASGKEDTALYAYYKYDPVQGKTVHTQLDRDHSESKDVVTEDYTWVNVGENNGAYSDAFYSETWSTKTKTGVYESYYKIFNLKDQSTAGSNRNSTSTSGMKKVVFKYVEGNELEEAKSNGEATYSPVSADNYSNGYYTFSYTQSGSGCDGDKTVSLQIYKYYKKDGDKYVYQDDTSSTNYYVYFGYDANGHYIVDSDKSGTSWTADTDHIQNATLAYYTKNTTYSYIEHMAPVSQAIAGGPILFTDTDTTSGGVRTKKTGNRNYDRYEMEKVADMGDSTGVYNIISYYSIIERTGGNYDWSGKTYAESSAVTSTEAADYTGKFSLVNQKFEDLADEDKPTVKGKITSHVMQAYNSYKANADKFKKYTLGLAYIDNDIKNGQDVDYFQFRGWYYEPECINPYVEGSLITNDTVLYADWLERYGDDTTEPTYTVTFEDGVSDEHADEVIGLPFSTYPTNSKYSLNTIEIGAGKKLVAPFDEPKRDGYVFTGWVTSAGTEVDLSVGYTVNENTVLVANWREIKDDGSDDYIIQFSSNLPVGVISDDTGLDNMPVTITGPAFYQANGERKEDRALPEEIPTRTDGYTFAGWYLEHEGINEFVLGDRVKYEFENNVITLYAKWIKDGTKFTVDFNALKPASTSNIVTDMPEKKEVVFGESLLLTTESIPKLEGNIAAKLESVNVKVITVTPKDLDKKFGSHKFILQNDYSLRNGESLIKRADYIVINENCENSFRQSWAENKNTVLFPQSRDYYGYSGSSGSYTFSGYSSFSATKSTETDSDGNTKIKSDISWTTTLELFKKIAGADRYKPCPVVFDYAIYENIVNGNGNSAQVDISEKFADGGTFSVFMQTSYSNNMYKLYLLATQANPITLYNAYLIKSPKRIDVNNGNILLIGSSTESYYTEGKRGYWNEYSLMPYSVIDTQEWYSDKDVALNTIGLRLAVSLDTSHGDYNAIYNRFYIYGYENSIAGSDKKINNIVGGYVTPSFSTYLNYGGNDVAEQLNGEGAYSAAAIGYFLLKQSGSYANFTTDINVLEIEPCDTYKTDEFWFWYISRCIPNYLGAPHVTGMTSSEFNGSVEELSSRYDIIYFGVNDQTLNKDLLFNVEDYETSTGTKLTAWEKLIGTSLVSSPIDIDVTQVITVPYEKYVEGATVTEFNVSTSYSATTPNKFEKIDEPVILENGILKLNLDKLGIYADWFGLSPYARTASQSLIFGFSLNDNYRYKDSSSNWQKFAALGITSSNGVDIPATDKGGSSPSGRSENFQANGSWLHIIDDWGNCYFTINEFYWGAKTTKSASKWISCAENTVVYAGDKIRFTSLTDNYMLLTHNYVYTHVGPSTFYSDKSTWSKIVEWFTNGRTIEYSDYVTLMGSFDDTTDGVNAFLMSGNDITLDKYNELLEYAREGHPIVFARDVITHLGSEVGANERMIDSGSNIYKLIDKLITDPEYSDSCFETIDASRDSIMSESIQKYAFSLNVQAPDDYNSVPEHKYLDDNTLEFTIQITTNSSDSANYSVALYVDTNADGKYSPEDEIIESPTVINLSNGSQVTESKLRAGSWYKITADISDDYEYGIAPWQLVVTNLTTRKQSGATGKIALKGSDEKENLYILQIVPNAADKRTVVLPTAEDIKNSSFGNNGAKLYDLTKDLRDYNLVTCRKTITEMKNFGAAEDFVVGHTEDDNEIYYSQIDMIILGCGEYYEISDVNTLNRIETFIAAGRPVIFTYDTTSYVNFKEKPNYDLTFWIPIVSLFTGGITIYKNRWPSDFTYWGYAETQKFREALGMDRFDVLTFKGRTDPAALNNAADLPYRLNADLSSNPKDVSKVYTASNGSNKKTLTQGFTNSTVALHYDKVKNIVPINDGQITSYPYLINPDGIQIGNTHAGYYQLDFEDDDMTVWYCLTSDMNTNAGNTPSSDPFYYGADARNNYYLYNHGNLTYSGIGATSSVTDDELKLFVNTIIAASRTGVKATVPIITNPEKATARKDMDYLYVDYDATLAKSEAQPFGTGIHTASNVGIDANGDGVIDRTLDTVYTKRVYFTLKDYSIIRNKKMIIEYQPIIETTGGAITRIGTTAFGFKTYECEEDGTEKVDGEGNKVSPPTYVFHYDVKDEHGATTKTNSYGGTVVETGKYYYVDVPISDNFYEAYGTTFAGYDALDDADKFMLRLEVVTRFGDITGTESASAANDALIGTKDVCIMRRGMFSLD